jgi:hypothetical protein
MKKVTALTLVTAASLFFMTIPSFAEDVISACAQKVNGQLRVVGGVKECRPSEVFLQWNAAPPAAVSAAPAPVIWSGGCSAAATQRGWNVYCTNVTEFDTAGAHLTVNPNGEIKIKVAGLYRINFWAPTSAASLGQVHVALNQNSIPFHQGSQVGHGQWVDNSAHTVWPLHVDDLLTVSLWIPIQGNFAYCPNTSTSICNRLQIEYLGVLP